MKTCKKCGSYAINPTWHGRDDTDTDLCDVCYWRKRAENCYECKKRKSNDELLINDNKDDIMNRSFDY